MSAEIMQSEERLRQAMLNSDVGELDALLATDLVFTTFLGEVISKEQDLAAHRSGLLNMHSIELSEQSFLPVGEVVITTCMAEIDATFDDERTKKQFRFTRVWASSKAGDKQVIAGQATLVYSSMMDE